jgi:hypothetical protein
MVIYLVEAFFKLMDYTIDPNFDVGIFKLKHDEIASRYRKLSVEEQGDYTHLIAERMK